MLLLPRLYLLGFPRVTIISRFSFYNQQKGFALMMCFAVIVYRFISALINTAVYSEYWSAYTVLFPPERPTLKRNLSFLFYYYSLLTIYMHTYTIRGHRNGLWVCFFLFSFFFFSLNCRVIVNCFKAAWYIAFNINALQIFFSSRTTICNKMLYVTNVKNGSGEFRQLCLCNSKY